jgi:pyruvate, water dikinase
MRYGPLEACIDPERFGGKAAQLGTATRAGLPVPDGVALSVEFVDVLAAGKDRARRELEAALSSLQFPLAVRSSAVGEDSATASFAGQHLTCLGVGELSAVADAVNEIWRSARSPAALAYRRRLGVTRAPRTAAVIQELVSADCAGVLFTRNPIDGTDEVVVEAAWGLGETVVAGLVTPDRFRIARAGAVIERVAGLKDVAVVPARGGGTRQIAVPEGRARALCLDDEQLTRLVSLARRCEDVSGRACDLEWAFSGGELHLLQCRPVTRAAPVTR